MLTLLRYVQRKAKKRRSCSTMQEMVIVLKPFLFAVLLAAFGLKPLVHAQVSQAGFISIDCGVSTDYTDNITGLSYVSDTTFRETGVPGSISPTLKTATLAQQLVTLRSFPNGTRNCYTIKPPTAASPKYLIRTRFMYGNYDGNNDVPTFDLHIGTNNWSTIQFKDAGIAVSKEIILNITTLFTSICLVNTGLGTPFISAIEARPITPSTYEPMYGSLALLTRLNFGSYLDQVTRYKDDIFDRFWVPFNWPEMAYINTSLTIEDALNNDFKPPSIVMTTAVTPKNASDPIKFFFTPKDSTTEYYVYMHFAEIEILEANQTREFYITLNGSLWYADVVRPKYLWPSTVFSSNPKSLNRFEFWLVRTENSTLPPIINAVEVYEVNRLLQSPTSQVEVNVWSEEKLARRSMCPSKITSLNLSSSGLTGVVPSYISDLQNLEILDLSNNNLNGSVPDFLTQLPSLRVLNLARNNLSGKVPSALIQRSDNGLLSLNVEDNLDLCNTTSCTNVEAPQIQVKKTKTNNAVVLIIASIAGVLAFILLLALAIWIYKNRINIDSKNTKNKHSIDDELALKVKNRQVSYPEVERMTNNFETVIGEGGFGTVYLGVLDGAQVAVKMLSATSSQGYKEFQAEVKLLMKVYHRNLTSLVGYCDDSNHKALIYEYMVNGSLLDQLSQKTKYVLNWKERLRIAVDAAQGLEYLHNGCTPSIVHRDVKPANILLDESFQAKIADFGLSRACPVEGGSSVMATAVAGTPGYLDPEYFIMHKLREKSDVFSFGVVILEIITGRGAITRNQETPHVSQWVKNTIQREGDVRGVVDSRLRGDFDVNSVWKAVEVALSCVAPTSAERPSMSEVVIELNDCLAMELARINGRATSSSNSIHMASLNIDTNSSPIPRK